MELCEDQTIDGNSTEDSKEAGTNRKLEKEFKHKINHKKFHSKSRAPKGISTKAQLGSIDI